MTSSTLGIAGAGRMGGALLNGWAKARASGFDRAIVVIEPHLSADIAPALKALDAQINPPADAAQALDTLILAIKPQTFAGAAEGLAPFVAPQTLVISIMAGVTVSAIKKKLGAARVVRAMPNTPGAIGRGITAYAPGAGLSEAESAQVEALLAPLGAVERVPNEAAIDAVTALSGSGPAYVFFLVEVMAAAGEAEGLDKETSMRLARQTVAGAGALLETSPDTAAALRQAVTSPGGTTAAALEVLTANEGGLAPLMRKAIRAAAKRAKELGT